MKFIVQAESLEKFLGQKGEQTVRRLLLLGAERDLTEQLCEFNLPPDHPEVGKGKEIEIEMREISSVFSGKPRLRGKLVG